MTPCILLKISRRFGRKRRLHLHGRIIGQTRNQLYLFHNSCSPGLFFDPEHGGGGHVPLKRRFTFNGLHVVISQKAELQNSDSYSGKEIMTKLGFLFSLLLSFVDETWTVQNNRSVI
jgi:hypothetical protein